MKRRGRWSWTAAQLGVLGLPLWASLGLLGDLQAGEGPVAAQIVVRLFGPGLIAAGALLGLMPHWFVPTRDGAEHRRWISASVSRMVTLLAVITVSTALLAAPDFVTPGGPWRLLAATVGTLVLPIWSCALLLRVRGVGLLRSAVGSLLPTIALGTGGLLAGLALLLPPGPTVLVAAVAGSVLSLGLLTAAWKELTAPLWAIVAGSILLGLVSGASVASQLNGIDPDLLIASGPVRYDSTAGRVVLAARPLYSPRNRLVEVKVPSGEWTALSPLVRQATFAQGVRYSLRASRLDHSLGLGDPTVHICTEEVDGEGVVCLASLKHGRHARLHAHAQLPLAFVSLQDRLTVVDRDQGKSWTLELPDEQIRWPCFLEDGSVLFRLLRVEGRYAQERVSVQGDELVREDLPFDHGHRCAISNEPEEGGRFIRQSKRSGLPSLVTGPGLPADGAPVGSVVVAWSWSADGSTLALRAAEPARVFVYRVGEPLDAPFAVPPLQLVSLSGDGGMLLGVGPALDGSTWWVWDLLDRGEDGVPRLLVTGTSTAADVLWAHDNSVLLLRDGRLVRVEPRSGERVDLFP